MRIIFFNIWHGKIWKDLKDFLQDQSPKTDIFCFLEVNPKLETKLENILPGYAFLYQEGIKVNYLNGTYEGRSIFVRKNIEIKEFGKVDIFKVTPSDAGGFQYAKLIIEGKEVFVGEVHGKARPGTKLDTIARLEQSKKILKFVERIKTPRIIGGDFNLLPGTESIKKFEEAGYTNLIKKFKVKSTRNRISWEQFKTQPEFVKQHFADYIFVSPDIKIKKFEVPYVEISDHLPLILDFEL